MSLFIKLIITLISIIIFYPTFIYANNEIKSQVAISKENDTVYHTKVEILNDSFDKLVTKLSSDEGFKWENISTPVVSVIIGGLIAFFAQLIAEKFRAKREKNLENKKAKRAELDLKRDLISKGQARVYLISNTIENLAMYKVHKQYYKRASQLEKKNSDSFKKHYEKGEQQRDTEVKLSEQIAIFIKIFTEFSIIIGNPDYFKDHLKKIYDYKHPISSKFLDIQKTKNWQDELHNELKVVESDLNKEYKVLLNYFTDIQSEMEKH